MLALDVVVPVSGKLDLDLELVVCMGVQLGVGAPLSLGLERKRTFPSEPW
jgi:hypothetical protein